MIKLIRFEMKKLIKSKMLIIVGVAIIGIIIAMVAGSLSSVFSYEENGAELSGFDAIARQKELDNSLSGDLTSARFAEIIEEYHKIISDKSNLTENGEMTNEAFCKYWFKYMNINSLLSETFSAQGEERNFDIVKTLSPLDGEAFYDKRLSQVSGYLNTEYSYGNYTDKEKKYFLEMSAEVDIPFYYDYSLGWKNLLDNLPMFLLVLTFIMCICISPVFANEYQTKTDSIIFSSKYGKSKVFSSKVLSSGIFSSIMYFMSVSVIAISMLGVYGFDGFNCNIQLDYLISPYNLNYLQAFFIILLSV